MNAKNIMFIGINFILTEIASFLIQHFLSKEFENIMIKEIVDNAIIYGTIIATITSIFMYFRWKYIWFKEQMNYFIVRNKYYDLCFMKYFNKGKNSSDYALTREEINANFKPISHKYLQAYMLLREEQYNSMITNAKK